MNILEIFTIAYSMIFFVSFTFFVAGKKLSSYLSFNDLLTREEHLRLLVPEALQKDIQLILNNYLNNLGERMPQGHSWQELAHKIHEGSQDKEFLLSILSDIIYNGTESEWVLMALQILKDWTFLP